LSWQKALILNKEEQVLHSWDGDCERRYTIAVRGLIRTKAKDLKQKTSGTLVLTNQRLMWLERRGRLSKTYRASFVIGLTNLQGISVGGAIKKWVSITDSNGEYAFHLKGIGKKEAEPFRDMILRQVEKVKVTPVQDATVVQKELEVRTEVVKIRCAYCNALYAQSLDRCPYCSGTHLPKAKISAEESAPTHEI